MAGKSNKQLHPYFRKLMKANSWENLSEMSRDTGLNLHTLRAWAFSRNNPSAIEAIKLAQALNLPIEQLLKNLVSNKAS